MRLLAFLRRESALPHRALAAMTILGAASTMAVLALISFGAAEARQHDPGVHVVVVFLVAVGLYYISQNAVMANTASEAERIIHRLRARLFACIESSDYSTVAAVGRATLHTAMAQETQTLSRTVAILAIAAQQAVTMVFVGLFLAWLTLPGCIAAILFGVFAVTIYVRRSNATNAMMARAADDERQLFDGLEHQLHGFKEVRTNPLLADRLVAETVAASDRVRHSKTLAKGRLTTNYVLIQVIFYLLMGLMVFAVPLFDPAFAQVALEVSIVTLFMIGPIATIAQAIPALSETEAALDRILALEARLGAAASDGDAEDGETLQEPIRDIALAGATYTYREADGTPGFTAGPLDATFRTGEIVFISGGNGSGKSTLLRLLCGLVQPDKGAVLVDGHPLRATQRQAYRDRIAAVLSDYHLFRRLYGLETVNPTRAATLLKTLEIDDKVGIADDAFTTVALSSGQRKRLALLVAILEDKPVLVLDEWAADQDPQFRRKFYEEILPSLRRPDRVIVCVTHDDAYFSAADRVLTLHEGRFRTL